MPCRFDIRRTVTGSHHADSIRMFFVFSVVAAVIMVLHRPVPPARPPGVMGGFDTMITEKTKNILIESAWWDPVTVRRMSKRHGLHTDASHRFERGADFESTVVSTN